MDTQASSSHGFKKIKLTIIPPKQLFDDLTSDNENLSTPSPTTTSFSPTPPNAPSKTTSTKETTLSHENTSSSFQSKLQIVDLEKTLAKQTKENFDLLMKIDNLENAFADEVKRLTTGKLTTFDKDNCDFGSKVTHLKKIIAQKTKDFDDVKLELSNKTAKFEAYFEKLENTKVVLERQLARKVDDSKAEKDQFLKEINHLKTQLENLKGKSVKIKFDKPSILGKPPADKPLINS
ncbi:hypothetical protein Tco_1031867 [Tanacetum coccineum]|uniref:Uncharacterized protein n=1 Tax=Tanacetum coccineum TaxID=301880 RepID=A0ABQ5GBK9_9ASTR